MTTITKDLLDLVRRQSDPEPWSEGDNIPWNDPEFSERMLQEHLSQEHDAASRRFETIDEHVDWIHDTLLRGKPGRVLDLGCGPGFYANRLARLDHELVGIDYSPASIAYARAEANGDELRCHFIEQDIRAANFGQGYDLVMLLFGELNVFRPSHAAKLVKKAHNALVDGGVLLLEPHTFAAVEGIGTEPRTWFSSNGGLFSTRPHVVLTESFWRPDSGTATKRYFVTDALTGDLTHFAQTFQAYGDLQYRMLLTQNGFRNFSTYPSLRGHPDPSQKGLIAIVARKPNAL
jgi:SAM-dependent methyltransferase